MDKQPIFDLSKFKHGIFQGKFIFTSLSWFVIQQKIEKQSFLFRLTKTDCFKFLFISLNICLCFFFKFFVHCQRQAYIWVSLLN